MFKFPKSLPKRISIVILGVFFILAGVNHFLNPRFYLAMMPPALPWHKGLVIISGIAEVIGGLGLFFKVTRRWAGYWLIAVLVAIFPANIYMVLNPGLFANMASTAALYLRLPLQFVLMAWVWWASRGE